jgi:hypothetical protein
MSLRSALGISILTIDVYGSTWGLGDVDVPTWFGREKVEARGRPQMSKMRRGRTFASLTRVTWRWVCSTSRARFPSPHLVYSHVRIFKRATIATFLSYHTR